MDICTSRRFVSEFELRHTRQHPVHEKHTMHLKRGGGQLWYSRGKMRGYARR